MTRDEDGGNAQVLQAFADIQDPRRRSCPYPLDELLLVALAAITSGADDWVSVVKWGQSKLDWLRRWLPFANGIASHDTFSRVFALLDAQRFEACFIAWMQLLCPSLAGEGLAVDGKSVRGSHEGGVNMAHLVSAWHTGAGMALGQVKTVGKSNEITAIPLLLDALDVQGAIITIDAMGCQREIVRKIVDKKADYIIGVKNNQPSLAQAVESLFDHTDAGVREGRLQQDITLDKDHGRLERRRCVVRHDVSAIAGRARAWAGFKTAVMVESRREFVNGRHKGKVSTEWRYYISSLDLDAAAFNQRVRAHWSIENNFHWVLDMTFREDACRIRRGHGAQNFAILRRIGLNLLKRERFAKASLNNKRLQAGWNTDYLEVVLGMKPPH
jgi:predicted transposase YbfD/YdcC